MVHRYDMDLKAPISETSIHRIRYRRRTISDHLDPISVQEKKCGGGRPGRFRTKWTKSILRGNGWSSMRPSDIGDDSGPAIGSISRRSRRFTPVAANRFGKQSAPECRGAFCMPCSGTDTEHTGKAIRTDIRTRNKAKRKASQKENTQKKKPSTTKSRTKEQAIQQQTENIHTHNQNRKPKTIPTKKKPRASCTRLRG